MKIHLAQYSTILQYIQIHVNWCFPTGKLLDGNRLSPSGNSQSSESSSVAMKPSRLEAV
jgi:hypothetical protein